MTNWQFNILFFVGVGGAVFALTPWFPTNSPLAGGGIGLILTFVLTQKDSLIKKDRSKDEIERK